MKTHRSGVETRWLFPKGTTLVVLPRAGAFEAFMSLRDRAEALADEDESAARVQVRHCQLQVTQSLDLSTPSRRLRLGRDWIFASALEASFTPVV